MKESQIKEGDNKNETKMSGLMPAIFSTSFSQTYADLLKTVIKPAGENRSEFTESEIGYPSPVFKANRKKDGLTDLSDSPLRSIELV